jgi:hypothetical protein
MIERDKGKQGGEFKPASVVMAMEYAEKSREGRSYIEISKAEAKTDAILASPYSFKGNGDGEL